MQADDIKNLADIIANHSLDNIERLLRVASISLRNTIDNNAIKDLKNRQELLSMAHQFLSNQTISVDGWRNSFTCFEQLTDWFESATQIENHKQLSMFSWYLQLDTILSSKIPPKDLIVLGAAYFGEPNKFAAFLYWLLENNVSPREIEDTKILHQYFAYHVCDISVLHQTYLLLSNLSEKSSNFLSHVNTTPSQMRGFINQQKEDSTLRSYNVMGELFAHNNTFEVLSEKSLKKLEFHINFHEMHANLFDLFGWQFINALNFRMEHHRVALKHLIQSSSRKKLIEDLPRYILSGQFSPRVGAMMLSTIGSVMPITSDSNNENTLIDLIKRDPFYIHTVKRGDLNRLPYSQVSLHETIQTLCTDVKYQNIHHLPYLVRLSKNLSEDLCFLLGEYSSFEHALVLKSIFDLLLQSGNILLDEEFELITPIIPELYPQTWRTMGVYSNNINAAIDAFNHHTIDYEAVLQLWGSQLSQVNLFKRFYSSLSREYVYPFTIYQLHAKILQDNYECCVLENRPFELNTLLEGISADPDRRIRIMQEALQTDFISEPLVEALLNLAVELNIVEQCVMQSFGDERSVLYHAYTSEKTALRSVLLRRIPIEDDSIIHIIKTAIEKQDLLGIDRLWSLIQFTGTIRNQTIASLLNQLENVPLNSLVIACYQNKLHQLLMTATADMLLKENIVSIFRLGVQYSELDLVIATCRFTGKNALSASEIKIMAEQAADHAQWEILALLCGLETGKMLNPDVFTPGNVSLYLNMVERYKEKTGVQNIAVPLNYMNDDEETLLHIAANHCSFSVFQSCFMYLKNNLIDSDIKNLLQTTTASGEFLKCNVETRDQKRINDYIEIQHTNYCRSNSSLATQTAIFFPRPAVRIFRRQRIEDDATDLDLESQGSRASSLSTNESLANDI